MKTIKSILFISLGTLIGMFLLFSCDSVSGGKTEYTLTTTVSPSEGGAITPESGKYSDGETISLTGNPNEGWRFVRWEQDLSTTANPVNMTITRDYTVIGVFERSPVFLNDNGVTIMCPEAPVGTTGIVGGVEYEVVDRDLLIQRRDQGSDLTRVCVSNVKDMTQMFSGASFNQPIGNWDVSNVWNMYEMFQRSYFNQPIENWDVSRVENFNRMFYEAPFNQPIGNWDVSNVTDMSWMFFASPFNQAIGNWDVSNVRNMDIMFRYSEFNQPINLCCVPKITSEPSGFSTGSPLTEENKPVWGTCPE